MRFCQTAPKFTCSLPRSLPRPAAHTQCNRLDAGARPHRRDGGVGLRQFERRSAVACANFIFAFAAPGSSCNTTNICKVSPLSFPYLVVNLRQFRACTKCVTTTPAPAPRSGPVRRPPCVRKHGAHGPDVAGPNCLIPPCLTDGDCPVHTALRSHSLMCGRTTRCARHPGSASATSSTPAPAATSRCASSVPSVGCVARAPCGP